MSCALNVFSAEHIHLRAISRIAGLALLVISPSMIAKISRLSTGDGDLCKSSTMTWRATLQCCGFHGSFSTLDSRNIPRRRKLEVHLSRSTETSLSNSRRLPIMVFYWKFTPEHSHDIPNVLGSFKIDVKLPRSCPAPQLGFLELSFGHSPVYNVKFLY